jgi:flagellar motor switch protein FliM
VTAESFASRTRAPSSWRQRAAEPEPYDFRRPLTLARDHARQMEIVSQRFARMWGTQLTARLRATCSVAFEGLALMPYEEYIASLPQPTGVVLCQMEPSRQTALVQIPVSTMLVWVDYLFGGTGRGDDREGRELTDIEFTVVRDLLQLALDDLHYAFSPLMSTTLTVKSVQYSPQFVQAVGAGDAVLVPSFTLHAGDRVDAATLMLPAETVFQAMRDQQGAATLGDDERQALAEARQQLESAVGEVPMDVAVRFTPLTVHPREVVNLAVGDVLPLVHPASAPLAVVVDGVELAHAAAASHGSRLVCQVVAVEEVPS